MSGLRVQNVSKSFDTKKAVIDVSFVVDRDEIVTLLGPSGCGKSTLLGLIAGLEVPDSGIIYWEGNSLSFVPPHRRFFGLMFQDYALFPHRNVFDNVAFGLKMQHLTPELITDRVHEVLSLVGMEQSDKRDVNTLSGGEQQRVALARSLAPKPRLLMLDEPLGALDRTLRERLVSDLRAILRQSQQTAIYVTHDQEEAFTVADRVVVMNRGKIIQIGTPIDIFNNPANPFVARFLGMNNLISGVVLQQYGKTLLDTKIGTFSLSHSPSPGKVIVLLRPDRVSLSQEKECNFSAIVKERIFRGSSWKLSVWVNELKLDFEVPAGEDVPNIGEPICLSFEPDHAFQFYKENENP